MGCSFWWHRWLLRSRWSTPSSLSLLFGLMSSFFWRGLGFRRKDLPDVLSCSGPNTKEKLALSGEGCELCSHPFCRTVHPLTMPAPFEVCSRYGHCQALSFSSLLFLLRMMRRVVVAEAQRTSIWTFWLALLCSILPECCRHAA